MKKISGNTIMTFFVIAILVIGISPLLISLSNYYNDPEMVRSINSQTTHTTESTSVTTVKNTTTTITTTTRSRKVIEQPLYVGDIVKIGHYEQDNNLSNGQEPINWLVLDVQSDKALIITEELLDYVQYHKSRISMTWENCYLREWMNEDFYYASFSDQEKEQIMTVKLENKNSSIGTNGGNATYDKVFALSMNEVNNYFLSDNKRVAYCTKYAIAQGHSYKDNSDWWWLRSPGKSDIYAALVSDKGKPVDMYGDYVDDDDIAIRPAMWISL